MLTVPETMYFETNLLDEGTIVKPRMAVFHNSYRCNQNCNYCFFHEHNFESNKTASKVMSANNIMNIIDQLSLFGVKSNDFCGGGEPLMTENMDKVFDRSSARNMKTSLLTNGILFEGKVMESAVTNCTWIRISLDTVNRELYKKVRGTDHCNLVLENIKKALIYKRQIKSECDISVKISLFEGITIKDIQDVFSYFKDSGISNIQIKHVWNNEGTYFSPDIKKDEIGNLEAFGNQIIRKVHYNRYMNEQCWINPFHTVIDAIGDVYLCCYYQGREDEHKIGNVFETPFEKLWASPLHREKLKNIKTKECLKHDCRFQKYMATIRRMQKRGTWEFV